MNKLKMPTLIVAILFSSPASQSHAIQVEKALVEAKIPTIELTGSLFGIKQGTVSFSKLEVPDVLPERKCRLELRLENGTARDIDFDEVRASCGCAKFSPTKGTLVSEETQSFSIDFKAPKSTASGEYLFSALLLKSGNPQVRLNFTCKLQGSLHLEKNWQFTIRNQKRTAMLPVNFTDPIEFGNLQLSLSDALSQQLDARLVLVDGNHFVEVEVNPNGWRSNELLAGRLTIKDNLTGAMATAEVLGKKKGELEASPSHLFFRPSSDGKNTGVANIILEIDKAVTENAVPTMSVICAKKNQAGKTKQQFSVAKSHRLSDSLYRVRLQHIRNESNKELPKSIELTIRFPGRKSMSLEIPCLFQY